MFHKINATFDQLSEYSNELYSIFLKFSTLGLLQDIPEEGPRPKI